MTRDTDSSGPTLAGLEHLLEVYGAERSRWPARERLRYSHFIAENPQARALLSEARALDALLDQAPEPPQGDMEALTARILAAAGAGEAAKRGNVTVLDPARSRQVRQPEDRLIGWSAAALLAASLVLGVFAGTAGVISTPFDSPSASASAESDEDVSRLALGADESGLIEEDLL